MTDVQQAREALHSISPDLPREDWVRAGMAAHAAGLELEDFDAWSSGGSTYDARAVRDVWRSFKGEARRIVFARAGGRCEATAFLVWGRCRAAAVEVDQVYPWSKGGATIVSNGQALCRHHNRSKASWTPAWWYIVPLERRRRRYFPSGEDVRVFARMTEADRAIRSAWTARQGRGMARGRRRF